MTLWDRISAALAALAKGEGLGAVFETLRTPPERTVAFTIAVIALGAKMAKADGHVTRDEVSAFRRVFEIPPAEEAAAARVFNLARQDVAGFEDYARRIKRMFSDDDQVLIDLMEGLFHIAVADGEYHPAEDAFLRRVSEIFDLGERCFLGLKARHLEAVAPDPYAVLGVAHEAPIDEIRAAWKRAVKECHPDRMRARGVPEEALVLANDRLVAVNAAWEEISAQRAA